MTWVRRFVFLSLTVLVAAASSFEATAQDKPEDILGEAKALFASASAAMGEERAQLFRDTRRILDRILDVAPASDLARDILFESSVDGVDVEVVNAEVRQALIARSAAIKAALLSRPARGPVGEPAATAGSVSQDAAVVGQGSLPVPGGNAVPAPVVMEPTPTAPTAEARPEPSGNAAPVAHSEPSGRFAAATAQAEGRLGLDRKSIREIQSRLTALGLDPRGIDGALGPGTRGAIRSWQQQSGIPPSGYLDAEQLRALRAGSQNQLDAWLRVPANARLFAPPPPVAITPARLNGTWRFTARCGPNSRIPNQTITGVLAVRHAGGNQYSGTVGNSQGFNGRLAARLDGRVLHTEINWGLLLGRVRMSGTFSDDVRSLSGRDSNGCRVSVRAG